MIFVAVAQLLVVRQREHHDFMSEDINQEILAELRKLKRIFYALLVVFILMAIPPFYYGVHQDSSNSWEQVRTVVGRQHFRRALAMAQTLVAARPDYAYGRVYLGYIYLALDDVTNAEAQYSQAYQLYPSEDYEKDLAAVRKRLAAGEAFKLQSTTTLPNTALEPTGVGAVSSASRSTSQLAGGSAFGR